MLLPPLGYPKHFNQVSPSERNLLLYRALILAQSVVSEGPLRFTKYKAQGLFSGSPQKAGCLLSLWSDSNYIIYIYNNH